MIRMRARMIDGTPIAFEMIDHGKQRDDSYLSEFTGCGFHVLSEWDYTLPPPHYGPTDGIGYWRAAYDRRALEGSGVDTTTVEIWEGWVEPPDDRMMFEIRGEWRRLW